MLCVAFGPGNTAVVLVVLGPFCAAMLVGIESASDDSVELSEDDAHTMAEPSRWSTLKRTLMSAMSSVNAARRIFRLGWDG